MTDSILERLDARIAVEPSLDNLDTLFMDLQAARDAIVTGDARVKELEAAQAARSEEPHDAGPPLSKVTEAIEHLTYARERLAVNALSTVGDNIASAISLLSERAVLKQEGIDDAGDSKDDGRIQGGEPA